MRRHPFYTAQILERLTEDQWLREGTHTEAGRYILATPIGRVKEIKDEVLSRPGRYAEITPNLRAKEVVIGEGERRRCYILCLNTEEAEREKRHRNELLDLLQSELDRLASDHPRAACRLVASKRFGAYLSLDAKGRPFIDRAKVRRAEQLDGKFVLTTNDDSLSAADIALGYKGMWIIEACFRKLKTTGLGKYFPFNVTVNEVRCSQARPDEFHLYRVFHFGPDAHWYMLPGELSKSCRLDATQYRAFVQGSGQRLSNG